VKNLVLWIAVAMAAAGLAFGLMPTLYGSFGDGDVTETIQLDEDGEPIEEDEDLSEEEEKELAEEEEIEQAHFNNDLIETLIFFSPYLVVLFGAAAGLAAGILGSKGEKDLAVGVAAGVLVGTILFMVLSNAIAIQQWSTVVDLEHLSDTRAIDTDLSLSYGTVLTNSIALGISTAVCATIAAVGGSRFTE